MPGTPLPSSLAELDLLTAFGTLFRDRMRMVAPFRIYE